MPEPASEMQAVPVPAGFDASNAPNAEDVEQGFAVLAVKHLETYWGILHKVKGSSLRLTKFDDDIMEDLRKTFPDFDPAKPLDEDEIKSPQGKEKWRNFMMAYSKKVDDYNFGTIVRTRADGEYTNEGTIFVPRMQFYAIEIARNRAGLNDWIYEKAQQKK